jgi:hypothetical protein
MLVVVMSETRHLQSNSLHYFRSSLLELGLKKKKINKYKIKKEKLENSCHMSIHRIAFRANITLRQMKLYLYKADVEG